jgi:hypothetical protein
MSGAGSPSKVSESVSRNLDGFEETKGLRLSRHLDTMGTISPGRRPFPISKSPCLSRNLDSGKPAHTSIVIGNGTLLPNRKVPSTSLQYGKNVCLLLQLYLQKEEPYVYSCKEVGGTVVLFFRGEHLLASNTVPGASAMVFRPGNAKTEAGAKPRACDPFGGGASAYFAVDLEGSTLKLKRGG